MGNPSGLSSSSSSSSSSSHDQANAATVPTPTVQATSENGTCDSMTRNSYDDASKRAEDSGPDTANSTVTKGDHDGRDEQRPPLPPRPSLLQTDLPTSPLAATIRPALQAKPTTAISSVDIQTLSFPDGSRGTFSTPASRSVSEAVSISGTSGGQSTPSRKVSRNGSEFDDSTSLMSYAPTLRANGDLASLLDEGLNSQSPAWKLLSSQAQTVNPFVKLDYEDLSLINFEHEFDEIDAVDPKGGNEGGLLVILLGAPSNNCYRRSFTPVEVKTQALPHPLLCWQANIQQTW